MTNNSNLAAYLERIGYRGELAPDLPTLQSLLQRHTEAIPFENLDPLLGRPVNLDLTSLQRKLVDSRRGGWCFEQNLLFKHVLETVGFEVQGLAARVFLNRSLDDIPPRSHMLLRVDCMEGSFVVDAGFGGLTLTGPVRLTPQTRQETPHEARRLLQVKDQYEMQAEIRGRWQVLYRFTLAEEMLPDYEIYNWFFANNPDTHFKNTLVAARPHPKGRYALRNNQLARHSLDGETERATLTTAAELRDVLEDVMFIQLPDDPAVKNLLARITEAEE